MVGGIVQPALVALASIAIGAHYTGLYTLPTRSAVPLHAQREPDTERLSCRPFLPKLFVDSPPAADNAHIAAAARTLDAHFTARVAHGDIDALSVAVVTSAGPVFEKNYGVINGNATSDRRPLHSHAQYRVASVSKLILVLEAWILQERGVLSWEDPVEKYIPGFTYRAGAFSPKALHEDANAGDAPITLAQLAAHTSGLGRDWPTGIVKNWPHDLFGSGPPPTNGHAFPSDEALYNAIASTRLLSPPNALPAYSNTGTGLLGLVLLAANKAAAKNVKGEPATYAELVQRDIFAPLGMNGSHFLATEGNKDFIVTPSLHPEIADQDFLGAMNPAGGQFSSLADLVKLTRSLLNPHDKKQRLLTPYSMDRWLKPVYAFEEDDWTFLGLIWEIVKHRDSNDRLRHIYWKLGAMASYHSALALHPGSSYGVVILLAGHYPDAARLAYDAFDVMQPAFDAALADSATELYAGKWTGNVHGNETDRAIISVEKGTLYLEELVLEGTNVLKTFFAPGRLALRSTERRDELRIDAGIPGYNGHVHMGCYPYIQDLWGMKNDVPTNLIYFTGDEDGKRSLHVPAAGVVLTRA
ncbi:beta-lactamase/transpeptidase-like protein [Exidia glandulosa HHB12029]|uniref:Beta-lactamase/transpeptidase-like protein n=1 Tax=Exidia glandulosa HHB12029 TaxID=1314781 RepID=A0A165F8B6_EXIGL|nr:beta-lactamase/transpeptidase-like protein [Exidia glandulosa HHB12029]